MTPCCLLGTYFSSPIRHECLPSVRDYVRPSKYPERSKAMVSEVWNRPRGPMRGSLLMLLLLLADLFLEMSKEEQTRKRTLAAQRHAKSFLVWNILINSKINIFLPCFKSPRVKKHFWTPWWNFIKRCSVSSAMIRQDEESGALWSETKGSIISNKNVVTPSTQILLSFLSIFKTARQNGTYISNNFWEGVQP